MLIRRMGWTIRLLVVVAAAVIWTAEARAAGEWEWTAGQGWIMGAGVSRPTPKEQLHYAYEVEQRGEFMDAARQYFLLVQNFPNSEEAGVGLQRLARCLFEMENYYTSYNAIEQVIKTYPNTGRMSDLVEIELRIAKRMMVSQTPDILAGEESANRESNVRRALTIIDSVIEHDPYGPSAAEAYLVKGEGNLYVGEINTARTAFETVRDEFPRSNYVERARLGILRCDSLVGQARPAELAEQIDVVREEERRRLGENATQEAGYDEFDDVEGSLRQLAEVEAAKMMDQAEQYRRMGTRSAVKASEFLYKEIVRRYPGTPQAEESMARLGNIKIPNEPGRIASAIRNINLNPFSWNKDPEPPWIVPQMDPEDMVMVDAGLGPIVGVPETGPPATAASAGVRPAALGDGSGQVDLAGVSAAGGFSPASAAPMPAPGFIDGVSDPRTYSSNPNALPPMTQVPPAFIDLEPARGSQILANNPLPTVNESDLIDVNGAPTMASAGGFAGGPAYPPTSSLPQPSLPGRYDQSGYGAPAPVQSIAPAPQPVPAAPQPPPTLGGVEYNAALSDLVGSASLASSPSTSSYYGQSQPYQAPISTYTPQPTYAEPYQPQSYSEPVYQAQPYQSQPYAAAPQQAIGSYYDPHTGTTVPIYQEPAPAQGYMAPQTQVYTQPGYQQPAQPNYSQPAPYGAPAYSSGQGGWTLSEDFR